MMAGDGSSLERHMAQETSTTSDGSFAAHGPAREVSAPGIYKRLDAARIQRPHRGGGMVA